MIAKSFERIHRSNLLGMGVLPLEFPQGCDRKTLTLNGTERFDLTGLAQGISPNMTLPLTIAPSDGRHETVSLQCRIDTLDEVAYYRHGGILHYVLRRLLGP